MLRIPPIANMAIDVRKKIDSFIHARYYEVTYLWYLDEHAIDVWEMTMWEWSFATSQQRPRFIGNELIRVYTSIPRGSTMAPAMRSLFVQQANGILNKLSLTIQIKPWCLRPLLQNHTNSNTAPSSSMPLVIQFDGAFNGTNVGTGVVMTYADPLRPYDGLSVLGPSRSSWDSS